jgi:hypothetical protein
VSGLLEEGPVTAESLSHCKQMTHSELNFLTVLNFCNLELNFLNSVLDGKLEINST